MGSIAGLEQLRAARVCSEPPSSQRVFQEKQLVGVEFQLLVIFGIRGWECLVWYKTQRRDGNVETSLQQLDRSCSEAVVALLGKDS